MNSFSRNKNVVIHTLGKLTQPVEINNDWYKSPWEGIEPLEVKKYMGPKPVHKPRVQAKMAYDKEAVYVIFRVVDRYVRCVRTDYQNPVYKDSAVEFFFSPSKDPSKGYFNLEVNCGGTALFKFRSEEKGNVLIPESDFRQIDIAHSLPKVVDPEIKSEVIWTIEMRIPINILKQYYDVTPPAPRAKWRANFYKIADESSHPHYLTWSKVDYPKPNFHLPQFFGILVFE
ncbi:carbohydrate-binding family 9-like protein [Autumnicola musiva]|uniref:Carbohydrate-binding family 9-like protein n=1 Tax=Autumnicola musiva TaxID=3075589 RepID=A0ABU3D6Q0_9FLAO|nr:carbohydrate-binding family 9-like protein [Zunongwangia sp. F117]MDT0677184.1 carbohydrate-binding family 9-like protein [Zunongwangia sp. F117]